MVKGAFIYPLKSALLVWERTGCWLISGETVILRGKVRDGARVLALLSSKAASCYRRQWGLHLLVSPFHFNFFLILPTVRASPLYLTQNSHEKPFPLSHSPKCACLLLRFPAQESVSFSPLQTHSAFSRVTCCRENPRKGYRSSKSDTKRLLLKRAHESLCIPILLTAKMVNGWN